MPHPLPNWIIQTDLRVWHLVNGSWHNEVLDTVMPFIRNQFTWAPLYLFLLVLMAMNFGWRGMIWVAAFLLCFGLADQTASHLIKPYVQRLRPCNDLVLRDSLRLLVPCGGGFSFPSSHAANHFALGIFASITLHRIWNKTWIVALFWALIVAYAQIYVGLHFPADVCGGALVGVFWGVLAGLLFRRFADLPARPPKKAEAVAPADPS